MTATDRRRRRARRRTYRQLRREARFFQKQLVQKASALGVEYWARDRDIDGKVVARHKQEMRFLQCRFSPEAFYWQVDMERLPWGVSTKQLADPDFAYDLSLTVGRQVRFKRSVSKGAWLILWRDESRAGVPNYVAYNKAFPLIAESAPPLTFIAGVAENRKLEIRDLAKLPHLLIGGSTDTGKSVFLNQVICTIVQRTTPDQVKLLMLDLKGGVELSFYRGLPHLAQDIVTEPEDVLPTLEAYLAEIYSRMKRFKGICRDIDGWNKQHPAERLPLYVMVFDEIAQVLLDKKVANYKGGSENLLSRCAAVGRAAGCYIIGATQRPDAKLMDGLIKQNFDARVAFSCASPFDSKTIINTGEAHGLSPQGRFIWKKGIDTFEAQGPNLTDDMVKKIVRAVIGARPKVEYRDWKEILRYARDNLDGHLGRRPLTDGLKGTGISELDVRRLIKNLAGKTVGLDGAGWYVEPPRPGVAPKMIPAGARPVNIPERPPVEENLQLTGQNGGPDQAAPDDDDDTAAFFDRLAAAASNGK